MCHILPENRAYIVFCFLIYFPGNINQDSACVGDSPKTNDDVFSIQACVEFCMADVGVTWSAAQLESSGQCSCHTDETCQNENELIGTRMAYLPCTVPGTPLEDRSECKSKY